MNQQVSYVIGSSHQVRSLSEADRKRLDSEPWVFCCNAFFTHWELASFRPTVWALGDNHTPDMIDELAAELRTVFEDQRLRERLKQIFVGLETEERLAELTIAQYPGLPIQTYRRGNAWFRCQQPATSLNQPIYHYGSTLTDLVNFAWMLNPGAEIRVFGNGYQIGWGHFWQDNPIQPCGDGARLWNEVQWCMWRGLSDLRNRHGLPIVDCNGQHGEPLPSSFALPRADGLFGPIIK